jgi:hypothetical protein
MHKLRRTSQLACFSVRPETATDAGKGVNKRVVLSSWPHNEAYAEPAVGRNLTDVAASLRHIVPGPATFPGVANIRLIAMRIQPWVCDLGPLKNLVTFDVVHLL